jgi:hypothetical protein
MRHRRLCLSPAKERRAFCGTSKASIIHDVKVYYQIYDTEKEKETAQLQKPPETDRPRPMRKL